MNVINGIMEDPFFSDSRVVGTLLVMVLSIVFVGYAVYTKQRHRAEDEVVEPVLSKAQKDRLSEWRKAESDPDHLRVRDNKEITQKGDDDDDDGGGGDKTVEDDNDDYDEVIHDEDIQVPDLVPSDAPDVDRKAIEEALNKAGACMHFQQSCHCN